MSAPDICPREVLKLLNTLGITKVTAPELKQFVIDLKKLTASDMRLECLENKTILSKNTGTERLTERSIISCPNCKCDIDRQAQSGENEPRSESLGNYLKPKTQGKIKKLEINKFSEDPVRERKLQSINNKPHTQNAERERLTGCPTLTCPNCKYNITRQSQSKVNEPRSASLGDYFKPTTNCKSKIKKAEIENFSKNPVQERKLRIPNNEQDPKNTGPKGFTGCPNIRCPNCKCNVASQPQGKENKPRPQSSGNCFCEEEIPVRHHRKMKSSKNFIKVPISEGSNKSDPVSLYHHYCALWEKYKKRLPGENDRADLRWSVREKLLGEKPTKNIKKTSNFSEEELAKRREGWID